LVYGEVIEARDAGKTIQPYKSIVKMTRQGRENGEC